MAKKKPRKQAQKSLVFKCGHTIPMAAAREHNPDGICPGCKAREENEREGLPSLKGSDFQIAWAEQIRRRARLSCEENVGRLQSEMPEGASLRLCLAIEEGLERFRAAIHESVSASFFIAQREWICGPALDDILYLWQQSLINDFRRELATSDRPVASE